MQKSSGTLYTQWVTQDETNFLDQFGDEMGSGMSTSTQVLTRGNFSKLSLT